jgi:DNA adenine methylase
MSVPASYNTKHQAVSMAKEFKQPTCPSAIIRWAGSKRQLLGELVAHVPPKYATYYEPFFGSGCLFFKLRPSKSILSDINPALISFYRQAKRNPRKVLDSARKFRRNEDSYYSVRERFNQLPKAADKAAYFLFLNRYCFNGLFRTNKSGGFNVPFGSRTGSFPTTEEFLNATRLLQTSKLMCTDFEIALASAKKADFVYLDPPYVYNKRKDRGEYGLESFTAIDIPRLDSVVETLNRRKVKFLLSYLDCDEIKGLAAQYNVKRIPVSRCISSLASSRGIVSEVLISNY